VLFYCIVWLRLSFINKRIWWWWWWIVLLRRCKKVVNAQHSAIITHKLYSLQTMQKQQYVDRFCRQHISSIFKCTPGKRNERSDGVFVARLHSKMYGLRHIYARTPSPRCPRKLLNPSPRWPRVIGPIPAVKPWTLSPYPRVPRGPRGEPAIPVPVQFSTHKYLFWNVAF